MTEVVCAVPGCENNLTDEQRENKIPVCSECEAANMHVCESCNKRLSTEQIQNGGSLCSECEGNPSGLEESMEEYGEEYIMGTDTEEEGFMVEESQEDEDFMV